MNKLFSRSVGHDAEVPKSHKFLSKEYFQISGSFDENSNKFLKSEVSIALSKTALFSSIKSGFISIKKVEITKCYSK